MRGTPLKRIPSQRLARVMTVALKRSMYTKSAGSNPYVSRSRGNCRVEWLGRAEKRGVVREVRKAYIDQPESTWMEKNIIYHMVLYPAQHIMSWIVHHHGLIPSTSCHGSCTTMDFYTAHHVMDRAPPWTCPCTMLPPCRR